MVVAVMVMQENRLRKLRPLTLIFFNFSDKLLILCGGRVFYFENLPDAI